MTSPGEYAGVRTMVLGARGFIGRHVARTLADLGADVVGVVRSEQAAPGVRMVVADLTRGDALEQLVAGHQPAIVFNLSGYGVDPTEREPAPATALNADLPPQLAAAVARHPAPSWRGQRIVHAGSALEYGTAPGDLAEETPGTPTTLYGRTKLDGTLRLRVAASSLGVRAATGRLFTVYGPGEQPPRLLPTLIAAAPGSDPIPLTAGTQYRDFTCVADAVEGLLRLGLSPEPDVGPVNVATGRLTTVRGFVEIAAAVLGIDRARLRFGALPTRAEEMAHDPVNVRRLRHLTDWQPSIEIREGIERARTCRFT